MGVDDENKGYKSSFDIFIDTVCYAVEGPVIWFRKTIVEPNQKQYNWYHQNFKRVPTIDQCYDDDVVCKTEANLQFIRDKKVDSQILSILRERFQDCMLYEAPDDSKCQKLWDIYEDAAGSWFEKYGDLGAFGNSEDAFMKQKHRMIWERRHGRVGTGMEGNRPQTANKVEEI
uniref:NADH dehydrogenase [ubiquinone] 1 beta subcomplex subunit 10 n=1 Tax=Clastoptera arizonana TaxID=38151 RepID=A0A1B6DSM6_9HEMI